MMARVPPLLAVVDDDADVRLALERLVASAGYAVESFACGADFLRGIADRAPDCVILDLHMPEISGFDVAAALAGMRPTLPVVVITGYDTAESRSRAMHLGASAYLLKPVDDEALLAAIGAAIGQ